MLNAQSFDGPVGSPGCKAISYDSTIIKSWATTVYETVRGPMDVAQPELGNASAGEPGMALGAAFTNGVVSLGDGGSITLGFNKAIKNNPGPDFAVFENGFSEAFLELAFVSVSSDGIHFYTFPAESESDTTLQINGFDALNCRNIYNLAGKYKAGFGTPFDLQDLTENPYLNLNSITHVRIKDVVGFLNPGFASRDSKGRKINDPYPTAYPTGGFDLDAIGVINESISYGQPAIWPNPITTNSIQISGLKTAETTDVQVIDTAGRIVGAWKSLTVDTSFQIDLPAGIYYAEFNTLGKVSSQKLVVL